MKNHLPDPGLSHAYDRGDYDQRVTTDEASSGHGCDNIGFYLHIYEFTLPRPKLP